MSTNCCYENWVQFDSPKNQEFKDEEEEETLSLCDLPINDQTNNPQSKKEKAAPDDDQELRTRIEEDFDFGSSLGAAAALLPENQMCDADEVFFQGQILPLRHSVSSDSPLLSGFKLETRNITRSESMSIISSRSSSIRSHNSTSSGSSSSTTSNKNDPRIIPLNGYKPRIRNQFHSHPSPTPQIRTQSFRSLSHSNPKMSSLWSFLQVGVLKPQEIGLADLKNRSKRFGSHNSNSSSTSSSMNSTMDQNHNKIHKTKSKIKKQRLFFGGCRCSVNSVDSTVSSRILMMKETEKSNKRKVRDESMLHSQRSAQETLKNFPTGQGKQAASRNRTFEWLKQLSIQESGSLD